MRGVLLFGCLSIACAHGPRPPPLTGWQELRSDHFRLRTDLAPDAARLTLQRLETLRAALQSAWIDPGETPDTADVIVLEDTTELLTFTDWLGLSTVSGSRPLLVTAGVSMAVFEVGEALPRVRLAGLEADPAARLALAGAIARAHPDSPDAAVFLAGALRDDGRERPGRTEAIARAVALAPEDPDALTAQAVERARAGNLTAALQTARRAVALAPWSRALSVLPHRAPPELVAAVRRDRSLIGSSCSPRTTPVR